MSGLHGRGKVHVSVFQGRLPPSPPNPLICLFQPLGGLNAIIASCEPAAAQWLIAGAEMVHVNVESREQRRRVVKAAAAAACALPGERARVHYATEQAQVELISVCYANS